MKDFFRTLRRLHFWIICPVIALMGVVGWWMATSAIQEVTQSRVNKINSLFNDMQTVSGKSPHPNDKVEEGMQQLIDARRNEVAEAWTEKYNQQVENLTWEFDEEKWPDDRRNRFVRVVQDLRPIEKTVAFPSEDEPLIITLRHRYRDYIKDELPRLARTIRARWSPTASGRGSRFQPSPMEDGIGGMPREEGTDEEEVQVVVEWDPSNQKEIVDTHFTWEERGTFFPGAMEEGGATGMTASSAPRPTTLDVLYAQEDFWVLQAIMNVIDATNRDPEDPSKPVTTSVNATVKAIHSIKIGANASVPQGRIKRAAVAASGGGQYPGGETMRMPEGMMGMPGGVGGADPAEGRYVDKNYQALPAETLRQVMTSEEAVDPESVYLAVAKRMPVRMSLKVDQRRLNRLLQECASADLTIEVRQIRINKELQGGSRPGSDYAISSRPRAGQNSGNSVEKDAFSFDVDVELYGIIYIYNPVDRKILGYEDEVSAEDDAAATEA